MPISSNEFQRFLEEATDEGGTVSQVRYVFFPYRDMDTAAMTFSSAIIGRVTTSTGDHTVITAYRQVAGMDDYAMWCGDKFAEGRVEPDDAKARCTEASTGLTDATALVADMLDVYNSFQPSTGCNFWTQWRRDRTPCKHIKTFLHYLRHNQSGFRSELKTAYEEKFQEVAQGEVSLTYELEDLIFRVPVLYEGDRGSGKTMRPRTFARQHNLPIVECPGHEGVESVDLLGYLVPYQQGQMVWKDGPLTEAFRSAVKTKTVLLLDEMLRIPARQLSILLTAFSPDEGILRLRTGRILDVKDGVAVEETLECPVSNLGVVATTNVGAEFAVDEIDPALAERFVVIRKDTTAEQLKAVLVKVAAKQDLPANLVTKAMKFYGNMVKAMASGTVRNVPTTRTMARAFELATTENDVAKGLRSQALLWVARTSEGKPEPTQLKAVYKMLENEFN